MAWTIVGSTSWEKTRITKSNKFRVQEYRSTVRSTMLVQSTMLRYIRVLSSSAGGVANMPPLLPLLLLCYSRKKG